MLPLRISLFDQKYIDSKRQDKKKTHSKQSKKHKKHNKPNQILLTGFKIKSTQNQNNKRKLFRK